MSGQDTIYAMVNERIMEALARGVVPWRQPWRSRDPFLHRNAVTGRAYRGVNVFLLALMQAAKGYATPRWLTFRQARDLGGKVKAGERATPVVFWKILEHEETDDAGADVTVKVPLLRYYNVFNVDQTEGVQEERLRPMEAPRMATFEPLVQAQRLADGYAEGPCVLHGDPRAYYLPIADTVNMPRPSDFDSREAYYGTLFHELTHSTGHAKRLNRTTLTLMSHFGDRLYGQEELVAEMGSAFLLAKAGVETWFEASAAYLQSWIRAIRGDRRLLVVASAQAQRAADWICGLRPAGLPEPAKQGHRADGADDHADKERDDFGLHEGADTSVTA